MLKTKAIMFKIIDTTLTEVETRFCYRYDSIQADTIDR